MDDRVATVADGVERYLATCNEVESLALAIRRLGFSVASVAAALRRACPPGEGDLPENWPDERRLCRLIAEVESARAQLGALWSAVPPKWREWLPHPCRIGRGLVGPDGVHGW
jgi:hypothetical protein